MDNRNATLRTKALVDAMQRLAGDGKVTLQKQLGETAIAQAVLGIRRSENPYGDPFAPLTSRTGIPLRDTGNNIQRSWTAEQETPTSFVFGNRFKYLATHQYGAVIKAKPGHALRFRVAHGGEAIYAWKKRKVGGTGKKFGNKTRYQEGFEQVGTTGTEIIVSKVTIPRRQMVPEMDTGGLGPRWTRAFERTIKSYLERLFTQPGGA